MPRYFFHFGDTASGVDAVVRNCPTTTVPASRLSAFLAKY